MAEKSLNPDDLPVLILAPTGRDAPLIQGALTTGGLTGIICHSLSEVSHSLGTGVGAVLLAIEALQPKPLREFVSVLQDQPPWSDIAITLLTLPSTGQQARIPEQFQNVGNVSVLERPLQPVTLVSVMRVALRSRSRQYEMRDLVKRLEASQNELHDKIIDLENLTVALQASNEKLQAHDRMKSSFISVVSHELRTPLTSLKGYVENLLAGIPGPLSEKQSYYLTRVLHNLERLARMVEDILDLSRIEGGHAPLNLAPVCISELLGEAIESFQAVARQKLITMNLVAEGELPKIQGDRDKLYQIVINLLDNATKYSPDGGQVQIDVRLHDDNFVQLCVSDWGCGIRPDELGHIFDPFYRGKDTVTQTRGSGLGLAITKLLVELHKGHIWIDSTWTVGTQCYVIFPIHR